MVSACVHGVCEHVYVVSPSVCAHHIVCASVCAFVSACVCDVSVCIHVEERCARGQRNRNQRKKMVESQRPFSLFQSWCLPQDQEDFWGIRCGKNSISQPAMPLKERSDNQESSGTPVQTDGICPLRLHTACTCVLSCAWLCDSTDYRLPGSSVYETLQARILEWVAISCSRGSSQPKDRTQVSCVSCIVRRILYHLHHLGRLHGHKSFLVGWFSLI